MGEAVAIPLVLSMASAGFSAASQGMAAQGQSTADQYKAQQLDQAAQYGELKATQTNAQMTRNLVTTLGNIDAVRAASHGDPSDPTNAAVRADIEDRGVQAKDITVANITQQSRMDESNAAYMRKASSDALLGGDLSIAGTLLKGGAGAIGPMSGSKIGSGTGTGFSLTGTGGLY